MMDVDAVKTSLEPFHIKVDKEIVNPTAEVIKKCLKEKKDYFGFAIIFVFAHGEKDHFWCYDYDEGSETGKVNVWNDFYPWFSGEQKPELKNCPKLFFHEWCQLSGNDSRADDSDQIGESHEDLADFLIYNAAMPGYKAFGNICKGSYSTQAFCRRLKEESAKCKSLQEILGLVSEDARKKHMQPMVCLTSPSKNLYLLREGEIHQLRSEFKKKFKRARLLGEGSFGVVFEAENRTDGKKYAIKRIQIMENREQIEKEFKLFADLPTNCLHIVRYFATWFDSAEFNFQMRKDGEKKIKLKLKNNSAPNILQFCYIQMELCGETLEQWLKKKSQRDRVESLKIFKQIIKGLAHLHKNNVIHRDIKPSNILFAKAEKDNDLRVCIADFGLARTIDNCSTQQAAGTELYIAPDIQLNKLDARIDMFSAGLILVELLHNCSGKDHYEILLDAKLKNLPPSFQNELKFSSIVLEKLLSHKCDKRPKSDELLDIMRNNADWNHKMILANVSKKNTNTLQNNEDMVFSQEEIKFESTCSDLKHSVPELNQWITTDTLCWNGIKDESERFSLPSSANTNTQWEASFKRYINDDFNIKVYCLLDKQLRAASFRVFAVVQEHPDVWTDGAAVLKSNDGWDCTFSKKLLSIKNIERIKVYVRIQWTELEQLSNLMWKDDVIHCRWLLRGWKAVTPSSNRWKMFSDKFGINGALWRIVIENEKSGDDRKFNVGVFVNHIPSYENSVRPTMKCSLFLFDEKFGDDKEDVRKEWRSCEWKDINKTNLESRDPLDVRVIMHFKSSD